MKKYHYVLGEVFDSDVCNMAIELRVTEKRCKKHWSKITVQNLCCFLNNSCITAWNTVSVWMLF